MWCICVCDFDKFMSKLSYGVSLLLYSVVVGRLRSILLLI